MNTRIAGLLAFALLASAAPTAVAGGLDGTPGGNSDSQKLISAALGLASMTGDGISGTVWLAYLRPDIHLGPFGVGLDLTAKIGPSGVDVTTDTLRDSIRYLSFGKKGAGPLYIRAGNLDAETLGTGMLVDNYSNLTLDEATRGEKRLGAVLDIDIPVVGVESIATNAPFLSEEQLGLRAYRVYVKPLPFIRAGFSSATDNSPQTGLSAPIQAAAVDVELHIGKNLLVPYVAAGRLTDKGQGLPSGDGYAGGLRGGFDLGALKLEYKGELRLCPSDFVPSLFDFAYETNKANELVDDMLAATPGGQTIGLAGSAKLTVAPLGLTVLGQVENTQPYTGDLAQVLELEPKVIAEATLKDRISMPVVGGTLSAGARYEAKFSSGSQDLGKLKTVVTWRAPIGLTLSFINERSYAKGREPIETVGIESGWSF